MSRPGLPTFLRDPLFQYLVLGLLATGTFLLVRGDTAQDDAARHIRVDADQVRWLHQAWESRWQRPPTAAELQGLIDDRVREEVLYRTGLAMGLDRNDEIFRRRIRQKIEMMTEDLATGAPPLEADLQAFLAENRADYRFPERRSFTHVYLNRDTRGTAADADAEALLAELRTDPGAAPNAGDRFLMDHDFGPQTPRLVSRNFGESFATALFELPVGSWQGPLSSGYGLHLVLVHEAIPGRDPTLDEVRDAVVRDYEVRARERARAEVYANLLKNYTVEIDEAAVQALPVTPEPGGGGR